MPILDDIMDHPVRGPERRRGRVLGYEFALQNNRKHGREDAVRDGFPRDPEAVWPHQINVRRLQA